MPGNEYGERMHNFFGQEGVSQDQHQSQVVGGSWSGFSNGLVGNQRQINPSFIDNLKSYSTQQQSVDPERGQSSNSQDGLSFNQQPIRPEYSRSLLQGHQQPANGYLHGNGNLVLQGSRNESNFLGVGADSSADKLSPARGFSAHLHNNPMRFEMGESPVNYDFFGGQQQLNRQLPGMLQPFPRQQMTFNDMELLKQQVMVKQMHEYQMQQQLHKQQQATRQLNSLNSNAVSGNHFSDNQSHPLINGVPLQDASNYRWQPDLMTGNTNWMHHGISSGVQSSTSGVMITPEHGQANLSAPKFQPSLYGMPVVGPNSPQNAFSSVQMDRLAAHHGSANRSSSLTNQSSSFLNQGNVHDGHILPRSTNQGKLLFSHTSVRGSNNRPDFENFHQGDSGERIISVQEESVQLKGFGLSEQSFMKVPENIDALQKSTSLDPTEEKILFGSDDNLWDAFGNSTDMSLTGNLLSSSSDIYDGCPSLQSGSWSALMQSAVAETSTDDAGVHEWGSKQHSVWAPHDSGVKESNTSSDRLHSDSTQTAVQHLQEKGNQVSGHGLLEKPMAQRIQVAEKIFHSSGSRVDRQNDLCSTQKNDGIEDRLGIWKAASNPNSAAPKEQKNHFTQNLQMQKASYEFGNADTGNVSSASRDLQGTLQQHLGNESTEKTISQLQSRDGCQILESYASNKAGLDDFSMLGGKEKQSGHVGSRPSTPRKFQYHPMGNIDVTDEPRREKVSHFGQSLLGQPAMNNQIDKGHVSQNDLNCTKEPFKGTGSENSRNTSASADESVDRFNQVKGASLRFELLNKAHQSPEYSMETIASGNPESKTSAEYGGQLRHSSASASQGFSLQLAPPSQPTSLPNTLQFSRNSLQPLNSLHTAPEKGGTSQSSYAPWASNQSFSQQSSYRAPFSGIPGENNVTSGFPFPKRYHQNQVMPVTSRQLAVNHFVSSSSELSTPQVKERDECSGIDQHGQSSQTQSSLNSTSHNKEGDAADGFQTLCTSQPLVASSSPQPRSSSSMFSDSPAGISPPQYRFWNQPSKPQTLPSINTEGSFLSPEKANKVSTQNGEDVSLSGNDIVMHELQSKDKGAKQTSDCLVQDGLNLKEAPDHVLNFGEAVSRSFSNNNHSASAGTDPQLISPQMAPSWYSQYGAFKNGLVQPVNETGRFTPSKMHEQSSNVESSVDGSHSVSKQQIQGSAPEAEIPSNSLPHDATEKFPKIEKPKKRTTATSELIPWNKEVSQSPKRLKTLSEAEVDWARASTRFTEKVGFETLLEDVPPIKSKRRLIYTTQLLQQLFHPPPARVVSLAASSSYEFVVYTVARAALGDACSSSTSTDGREGFSRPNSSNPLPERTETERISDQYISKAPEDFISRTKKLETDFTALEKGSSISDLSVEVQDIEKFAVINRFAKFHPSSSSPMDRNPRSHRSSNSQRYVSIAPMPRNIPDSLQCLSL